MDENHSNPLRISKEALRVNLDNASKEAGLTRVEQLMFVNLLSDIKGTQSTGDKILAFMHKCTELNKDSGIDWITEYMPQRYTTLKKKISKKVKEINNATDVRAGICSAFCYLQLFNTYLSAFRWRSFTPVQ